MFLFLFDCHWFSSLSTTDLFAARNKKHKNASYSTAAFIVRRLRRLEASKAFAEDSVLFPRRKHGCSLIWWENMFVIASGYLTKTAIIKALKLYKSLRCKFAFTPSSTVSSTPLLRRVFYCFALSSKPSLRLQIRNIWRGFPFLLWL